MSVVKVYQLVSLLLFYGFESEMRDLIVLVPDHCMSFYFAFLKVYPCTISHIEVGHNLHILCAEVVKLYIGSYTSGHFI